MTPVIRWVFVKNGYVAFDGDKAIGTVFIPRKGNWHSWVIPDGSYANDGKANGRNNAKTALVNAYMKGKNS